MMVPISICSELHLSGAWIANIAKRPKNDDSSDVKK